MEKQNWNARLYDQNHAFVSEYGLDVVSLLDPKPGEAVLDLGCGTGTLTHEIARAGATVVGLDHSQAMIEKAKESFPRLQFAVGDGHDFSFPQKFDAVFSNAALHWMLEPQKVVRSVWNALEDGGRFVAEFGGKGNVAQVVNAISAGLGLSHDALHDASAASKLVNYFPSVAEYTALLEAQGFRVTHAFHFDRPTPLEGAEGLRNWVRMFRSFVLEGLSPDEQERLFSRIEKEARPALYRDGVWYADYRRLRIRAVR